MKELINVMILIPLLAWAWIGYQRVFPDGLNLARETPAATQQAQTGDSTGNQSLTDKSETDKESGATSTEAGAGRSEKDKGPGYTDQQLLADANQESMNELKASAGTSSATEPGIDIEKTARARLDQAISLMERLNKLGGH